MNNSKDLLSKFFFTTYNANYNLEFIESKNKKSKQQPTTDENKDSSKYDNHPIVKAIIEQLGGREFKWFKKSSCFYWQHQVIIIL